MVIISFVIIIITTINTCPRIIPRFNLYVHRRLFLSQYHWFRERCIHNPFVRRLCLECLAFAFGLSAFANLVGLGGLRGTKGVTPSGLVSLVADGSDGVAPAGLYSQQLVADRFQNL